MQKRIDSLVEAYTRGVIRWRWGVLLLSLLVAVAAAGGGRNLVFDSDYRTFFGSTFSLAKTTRDNAEVQRLRNRVKAAKTEKVLREFEMSDAA